MANTYQIKTKNTCIITGVAGYIGLNLAEFFLKQNYIVYGIDNFFSSDIIRDKILKNICELFNSIIKTDVSRFIIPVFFFINDFFLQLRCY